MIKALENVGQINGIKVMTNKQRPLTVEGDVDWQAFDEKREEYPICVDHEKDMISFKMMTKSLRDGGDLRNAQLTELITIAMLLIDAQPGCRENSASVLKLEEVIMWQNKRTCREIREEDARRKIEIAKFEEECMKDEGLELGEPIEEYGLDSDDEGNSTLAIIEEEVCDE